MAGEEVLSGYGVTHVFMLNGVNAGMKPAKVGLPISPTGKDAFVPFPLPFRQLFPSWAEERELDLLPLAAFSAQPVDISALCPAPAQGQGSGRNSEHINKVCGVGENSKASYLYFVGGHQPAQHIVQTLLFFHTHAHTPEQ